jgi:hypothetical protein
LWGKGNTNAIKTVIAAIDETFDWKMCYGYKELMQDKHAQMFAAFVHSLGRACGSGLTNLGIGEQ